MSTYHQKSRRNLLLSTIPQQQLFHQSPEEHSRPEQEEELIKIQEICDKQSFNLQNQVTFKTEEKLSKTLKKRESMPKAGRKVSDDEWDGLSQSQYRPDSFESSSDQLEESFERQNRLESECQNNLIDLIKKYETELSQAKDDARIRQMADCLNINVDIVKRHVAGYLRKRRRRGQCQARIEHQTIYKKTQMFDDAIRKVLKSTPYACINDLRDQIRLKLNLELAKQTLIRRLKNLNYHYLKFQIIKAEKRDAATIVLRKQYLAAMKELFAEGSKVIYYGMVHMSLDECRGSMWMKLKPNGDVDHILKEQDLVNVVLILSRERIQFFKIYHGFYKQANHIDAITRWLSKTDRQKTPSKKSRDNIFLALEASLLHFKGGQMGGRVSEMLDKAGVRVLPFPGYSSSCNPAEVLFHQIKYQSRGKIKSMSINELRSCIEKVMRENIDRQDISFAFKKVQEAIHKN